MRGFPIGRRLRAAALAVLLALPAPGIGWGGAAVSAAVTLAWPDAAWARRGFSGGYARPSFRSFGGGGSSFSARRPGFSGGYARPRTPDFAPRQNFGSSPGDRAVGRSGSGAAFDRFQQERTRPFTGTPGTRGPSGGGAWTSTSRSAWYGSRGWAMPPYAYGMSRRFGMWDAMFLWFMLDSLNTPSHAAFFYNHQDDRGYRDWRAQAEAKAADDPDLRKKLDALDADLAARNGTPRDPDYLPADVPAEAALAEPAAAPPPGGGSPWVVPLFAAALFLLWRARRQRALGTAGRGGTTARPRAAGRQASTGKEDDMGTLKTAAEMLRRKFTGETYTPSRFRVGMTLAVDPAPFLLAAGPTKVAAPAADAGGLVPVEAVGTLSAGAAELTRLYLPGKVGFFQLHLDAAGSPDECRYFAVIDEVDPADEDEWGFWLDDSEGMIGWAQFETKDGRTYDRVWSPGLRRARPIAFDESVRTAAGTAPRSERTMLYGAPTGAAPPAPPTEYILVSAVDADGRAWVRIAAGIDVNPASLSLS